MINDSGSVDLYGKTEIPPPNTLSQRGRENWLRLIRSLVNRKGGLGSQSRVDPESYLE
jgi:hypothetical protein